MPQTQVQDETAAAIGQSVAATWGAEASLVFDGAGEGHEGEVEPSAAVRVGPETVWLTGEFPPGLPEAVAAALGGEVPAETPPLDPAATCLSYRWGWAEQSGWVDIHALPETWVAFGDGVPAGEIAPGEAEPAADDPAAEAPPARTAPEADALAAAGSEALAFLPSLTDRRTGSASGGIELLLDVPLDVTVELGRAQRQIRDVLELRAGSIIALNRPAGEPVDVLVNGRTVARGEVIVIDENFGVRITDVLSQAERLSRLA